VEYKVNDIADPVFSFKGYAAGCETFPTTEHSSSNYKERMATLLEILNADIICIYHCFDG